jgi:hypothetical protein
MYDVFQKRELAMKKVMFLFLVAVIFGAAPTKAQVLNFDGIASCDASVGSYYNGGTAGDGSGPGPNFGIVFSNNAITLQDFFAGGSGFPCNSNTGNMPSSPMGLFFLSGSAATMDVAAGFTTGFSFFYTAQNNPGSVSVWSGLDGTGTLLASLALPTNDSTCLVTPTFCHWDPIGVSFSGTAESVNFGGSANQVVFDNITLNSSTPGTTPEPGTLVQMGSGLIGLAGALRHILRKA